MSTVPPMITSFREARAREQGKSLFSGVHGALHMEQRKKRINIIYKDMLDEQIAFLVDQGRHSQALSLAQLMPVVDNEIREAGKESARALQMQSSFVDLHRKYTNMTTGLEQQLQLGGAFLAYHKGTIATALNAPASDNEGRAGYKPVCHPCMFIHSAGLKTGNRGKKERKREREKRSEGERKMKRRRAFDTPLSSLQSSLLIALFR